MFQSPRAMSRISSTWCCSEQNYRTERPNHQLQDENGFYSILTHSRSQQLCRLYRLFILPMSSSVSGRRVSQLPARVSFFPIYYIPLRFPTSNSTKTESVRRIVKIPWLIFRFPTKDKKKITFELLPKNIQATTPLSLPRHIS